MVWVYYLLSFLAGAAMTLQSGVNGQLKTATGSPIAASLISFVIGTVCLLIAYAVSKARGMYPQPDGSSTAGVSWWMLTGGLLGVLAVITITVAPGKIGFANVFTLIVCAQVLLSLVFDSVGAFGQTVRELTPQRIIGAVLLIAGVLLIQKN